MQVKDAVNSGDTIAASIRNFDKELSVVSNTGEAVIMIVGGREKFDIIPFKPRQGFI